MARVLAIIHIVVGALLVIFGIVDVALPFYGTYIRALFLPVAFGVWVSFAQVLEFRFKYQFKVHANKSLAFAVVFLTLAYQPARCFKSVNHFEFLS